jgi:hypothetical protein
MNYKNIFHKISYLQYPFLFLGLIAMVYPYIKDFENTAKNLEIIINSINNMLILTGIGVSFSSLQDTTKTQNEISRKVWEDPKKSKRFIVMLSIAVFVLFSFGIYATFLAQNNLIEQLGIGTLVLSISLIAILKAALEMAEFNRKM